MIFSGIRCHDALASQTKSKAWVGLKLWNKRKWHLDTQCLLKIKTNSKTNISQNDVNAVPICLNCFQKAHLMYSLALIWECSDQAAMLKIEACQHALWSDQPPKQIPEKLLLQYTLRGCVITLCSGLYCIFT